MEASLRPVVYPVVTQEWINAGEYDRLHRLPLVNGGSGVALNIEGTITWQSPDGAEIEQTLLRTALAGGHWEWSRLNGPVRDWMTAKGVIRYSGIDNQNGSRGSP